MASTKVHYTSMAANDGLSDDNDDDCQAEKAPFLDDITFLRPASTIDWRQSKRSLGVTVLLLSLASNVLFLAAIITNAFRLSECSTDASRTAIASTFSKLYSPAQHILQPTLRKFSSAFDPQGDDWIFQQASSSDVDDAWASLYYTTLAIDRAAAAQLPNKTIPVSQDADAPYLTGLSVFHDLHCLDSIRKALWAGSANSSASSTAHTTEMHDVPHLMHCINGLRQTLMCHADVAPLSWQWSEEEGDVRVYQDVVHQCRDFSQVLEWGRAHSYDGGLDTSVYTDRHPPEIGRCGVNDEGCDAELLEALHDLGSRVMM